MAQITTINPATEKPIRKYRVFTDADINITVKKAKSAFESWKKTSLDYRIRLVKNCSKVLRKRKKELSKLITIEMGKPISQSVAEIEKCAWLCDYTAKHAKSFLRDELIKTEAKKSFVAFEPLGVVAAVMPWNFTFWQVLRSAIPALTAGNTFVLKHSSTCIGSSLAIAKTMRDAGFPKAVFQTIIGGPQEGEFLVTHPDVNAITVTGSVETGRRIYQLASQGLKKCVLELGGSDAFIILDDANLKLTCKEAVEGRLVASGQSCIAAKRFIVTRKRAKEFTQLFVELMEEKKVGNPLDMEMEVGPMAKLNQLEKLDSQVKKSVAMGAKLLCGGRRLPWIGYYYAPTVLANVTKNMPVVREETFGPVAPIIIVRDEKAAIKAANDTSFGLGTSIWTSDLKKGEKLARQIESGLVFVNEHVRSDPRMPFGGVKNSGIGRELDRYGMLEFTNIKSIKIS